MLIAFIRRSSADRRTRTAKQKAKTNEKSIDAICIRIQRVFSFGSTFLAIHLTILPLIGPALFRNHVLKFLRSAVRRRSALLALFALFHLHSTRHECITAYGAAVRVQFVSFCSCTKARNLASMQSTHTHANVYILLRSGSQQRRFKHNFCNLKVSRVCVALFLSSRSARSHFQFSSLLLCSILIRCARTLLHIHRAPSACPEDGNDSVIESAIGGNYRVRSGGRYSCTIAGLWPEVYASFLSLWIRSTAWNFSEQMKQYNQLLAANTTSSINQYCKNRKIRKMNSRVSNLGMYTIVRLL